MQQATDKPKPNRVRCHRYAGFAHRFCSCGGQVALPINGTPVGCPTCHRLLVWKNYRVETVSTPGDRHHP